MIKLVGPTFYSIDELMEWIFHVECGDCYWKDIGL